MNKNKVFARGTPATFRSIDQCSFCPFDAIAKKVVPRKRIAFSKRYTERKIIDRDSRTAKPDHWCQEYRVLAKADSTYLGNLIDRITVDY